jgi:hypothetical protein
MNGELMVLSLHHGRSLIRAMHCHVARRDPAYALTSSSRKPWRQMITAALATRHRSSSVLAAQRRRRAEPRRRFAAG